MGKLGASLLNFIAKSFMANPSGMLIVTTVFGWVTASTAQIISIARNPKYTNEQKNFLLPQELSDAAINIGAFFAITTASKKFALKMFQTGKLVPKIVREYLNKNENLRKQVGKLDFNLDKYAKEDKLFPKNEYECCRDLFTTGVTVGAGILSSNVITPIIRNKMASNMQHTYINNKDVIEQELSKPVKLPLNKPTSMKI